jgi:hypothetical protein
MSPGAPGFPWRSVGRRDRGGIVWPSVIAILFATFATLSFAIDQSVTVSILTDLPIDAEAQ